ncbi:dTDP-4-dehydrorhamnose 3,5-epimerase family protein [Plantactinospora sp. ZYX-F-223]|uniref:dTDP-4-dehydrorhamnose 3,5-epimerase family protein n=1 Tax=Plantactinospora sp. ZYX-F-223 TaxID=3144103 RepID=UPI0031FC5E5C
MASVEITPMTVPNAFRIKPEQLSDNRGYFYEAFRQSLLSEAIGYPFRIRQANHSVSVRNTLRGIHTTVLPPGQAKVVTCVRGAVLDIVVDLRIGSPTFGTFDITRQDAESGLSVYLADGIGHAFLALTDDACMNYLCSEEYLPGTMVDIDALDPDLALPWPLDEPPIRSSKDAKAPSVAEAARMGLLSTYDECLAHYAMLAASVA